MKAADFSNLSPGKLSRNTAGALSFIPNDLPPALESSWEMAQLLGEADRGLSRLAGLAQNLPNPHLLISPFSRREAVLSRDRKSVV